MVSRSIEDFFEFRRGKMTFQEYSTEWDRRLEEATTRAGLDLNDNEVDANLTTKFVDDIKLQLQGGLEKVSRSKEPGVALDNPEGRCW